MNQFNAPKINCPYCEAELYVIGNEVLCNKCEQSFELEGLWEYWNEGLLSEREVNNLVPVYMSRYTLDEALPF